MESFVFFLVWTLKQFHRTATKWVLHSDVDEYVFSGIDNERNFISRFVASMESATDFSDKWFGEGDFVALVQTIRLKIIASSIFFLA